MRNTFLGLCAVALVGGLFCACSDNSGDNASRPEAGNTVNFALGSMPSRTIFDENNKYQINWTAGDKVRIYCAEAEGASNADYNVVDIDATNKNKAKLEYSENGLVWGSDDGVHNFFAVYPADANKVSVSDGVATFKINYNQTCTVQGSADANGHYTTAPDMTNAYMVANLSTAPVDQVTLSFRPIMTTLDITVKGEQGVNANTVRITGLSITNKSVQYESENGNFRYDIINNNIIGLGANSPARRGNIFVGVKNGADNYIDLKGGQTITFTVFLPPVPINADNQIDINVHATAETSATYTVTVGGNTDAEGNSVQYTPSSKGGIDLGYIPTTTQTSSNWITPLDGDIYVSQMSIPGSHDAATGETMATIIGDIFAATQEKTLNAQWDMGVRAFDLRPAIYDAIIGSTNELWLYHGMTRVSISWATAMNTIKAKLTDNPGEFAVVLFRHEDEGTLGKNNNTSDFNNFMTDYVNSNKGWIVDWKPDLTIDEARGKIILISRFAGSWEYGCFTGWGHGQEGAVTTLNNAGATKSTTMYVQDYYNPDSHALKWNSIKSYLDISRTFHTDPTKVNAWMINHCSGYTGSSSSSTYRNNAAYQNPKLIEYLQSDTWEGSTGIILFDYTASSTSGSTAVYGDVAVQTVIDNNYKYRMKRKGE